MRIQQDSLYTSPSFRMPTSLKFFVREDGQDFPVSQMTEPETAAIAECVDDFVPSWTAPHWFETDTCLDWDDDADEGPPYGLLCCYVHNPNPKNGSLLQSRLAHPIPQETLAQLAGKTFRVHPRQLGVNPWGAKVEIVFEPDPDSPKPVPPVPLPEPEPAPAPAPAPAKAGIKASALIAAALQVK